MGEEKEYISVRFLHFSCFNTYVFIFQGKKRESKYRSSLMEKQSGKEGEISEKETFLDIQTYTFNKSVHLTFKKT